ncbi:MAG: ATP-binding cassette domain-containing protein [Elusimicrobiota bacterium]
MSSVIAVRNVFWRPSGPYAREILKNISIDIKEGDFVILRGPACSGKTSLLKTIYGDLSPSSGIVAFKNRNYENTSKKELKNIKKNIAFCTEFPKFIDTASLFENLKFILKLKKIPEEIVFDKIIHILKLTNLISIRDITPDKLSSTERKLFSLALELIKEKEIFLCDFNLSGHSDTQIIDILKSISYREGAVVITAKEDVKFKAMNIKYINMDNGYIK